MNHVVMIKPWTHPESFRAHCSCGKFTATNAIKWVFLETQAHYVSVGLTREGRGLIVDTIAGDGVTGPPKPEAKREPASQLPRSASTDEGYTETPPDGTMGA